MGRLFDPVQVAEETVRAALAIGWPTVRLGALLKASQNATYSASDTAAEGRRVVVRATPDADRAHWQRIVDEVAIVHALDAVLPGVCAAVPPTANDGSSSAGALWHDGIAVVVSRWAEGTPVDFAAYAWLDDEPLVRAWGEWFARLHAATRVYAHQHPDVAHRVRRWDELHDHVLAGSPIHPDDAAVVGDLRHYGILHGDLNLSNFNVSPTPSGPALSVYDWDQLQLGWFEFDVAQACITAVMLAEAGGFDGQPVPRADPAAFQAWIVAGYESVAGPGSIDRARFARMLALRKRFYGAFCRRALAEGDLPSSMDFFVRYVVKWLDAHPA